MTPRLARLSLAAVMLAASAAASAQINPPLTINPSGVYNLFPTQNAFGPTGAALQTNYPYPGQCLADLTNQALFPQLNLCPTTPPLETPAGSKLWAGFSFTSPSGRTAGDWADSGRLIPYRALQPILPRSVPPVTVPPTPATPRFAWPVLIPLDYSVDTATFPGADYYEIGVHEAWGFQNIASAGLFPDPLAVGGQAVPNGMQWTGLVCNILAGCACPADASSTFKNRYCTVTKNGLPAVPSGAPLFTPIWGVGQIPTLAQPGGVNQLLGSPCKDALGNPVACPTSDWSLNNYYATWPSISIRGTTGRPVVVKWTNEFPNNHVFCPHPEAADWPCAIDRTFMGVKARVDPATNPGVAADGVNPFGSPQQPDNSWVTHLHGGEIPPSTDGFAEKWYGNAVTAPAYQNTFVSPPFDNPSGIVLKRPAGYSDTYTYPMVNDEGTIWFHDHTLGKTHHNVIAGPAGFFPVKDPSKHGAITNGVCAPGQTCDYSWSDVVTEPRNGLGQPLYDLYLAIQDRSFNEDGSINFANGLGQVIPPGILPVGYGTLTPGPNPQVHPTWVPEYFADHVVVNGVLWPRFAAAPGWYRLRLVDGSDSRCWTIGFTTTFAAPGTKPTNNVPFFVIGDDQGYLPKPVQAPANQLTMCPGERYELLVNLGTPFPAGTGTIWMTNTAPAPFPVGISPMDKASPYAEMNLVMRFDVSPANGAAVKTCAKNVLNTWDPAWTQAQMAASIASGASCIPQQPQQMVLDPKFQDIRPKMPFPAGTIVRQVYLNEKLDGTTLASLGIQLNGVPFEYKVTETPKKGTREVWQFINTTGDAHPMHPHLVKHQIVARQAFNVGSYIASICGSTTCQLGPAPGGEMQVIPDVTPFLTGGPVLVNANSVEGGWKDATQALPGMVTTIVADWTPRWATGATVTAPGGVGSTCTNGNGCAAPYLYEDVTVGPYVWHCHINSHEDSEMMHTSLVVP